MSWERVAIGSIAETITKGTTPTSIGYDFSDQGISFLRVNNIQNGELDINDILFIDDKTDNALKRSRIKPQDVLLSIAGTIGRTAVVPNNAPAMNCNQAVAIIRLKESVLPGYLNHWLNTSDAIKQISGSKVTATISNLSLGCIKNLEMPLPPLEEQRRIAAILDQADAVRRKRKEAIALTEELLRSTFLEMFGDPVTNPKGWEVIELGKLLTFLTSGSRGWAKYYAKDGSLFLRIQNVKDGRLLLDDIAFVNAPDSAESRRTCVQDGDVLVSITADLGRTAVIPKGLGKAYINQHLALLRLNKELIFPEYVAAFLTSIGGQVQFDRLNREGVKAGLNFDDLRSLYILLPPLDDQLQYLVFLKAQNDALERQNAGVDDSENLFNSLLQRAFRGELSA
jgi:type I restriction enzyme, S subunit